MVESRVVPRTLSGMSFPAIACITGLGSNRSTCEGPPPCQRTTTRFALGAKWGRPGSPVSPLGRSAPAPRGAGSHERRQGGHPDSARRRAEQLTAGHAGDIFTMKVVHAMISHLLDSGTGTPHSRVRASSRFRIARQTAESAACSATSSVSSRFDSPTREERPRTRVVLRVDRRPACRRRDAGPRGRAPSACGTSRVGRRSTAGHRGSFDAFMLRSARARAASTQVGSLSVVSACSGVLVVPDRTRQVCRFEASNMLAGPTVRRQNV